MRMTSMHIMRLDIRTRHQPVSGPNIAHRRLAAAGYINPYGCHKITCFGAFPSTPTPVAVARFLTTFFSATAAASDPPTAIPLPPGPVGALPGSFEADAQ